MNGEPQEAADSPVLLLTTHQPDWLETAGVPLFISDTRLRRYTRYPRAISPWAVDSGGFTALQRFGRWTTTPEEYVERLRRYRDEIGMMLWAACQDWMCEPVVINGGFAGGARFVGTHMTVHEHQQRTVDSLVHLRHIAPDLPIIPVLQGYEIDEYVRCAQLYAERGIDLTAEPLVGVGSVCRRQADEEIHAVISAIRGLGISRIHAFGVKTLGLGLYGHLLSSVDSCAWSMNARWRGTPLPGCTGHSTCSNCQIYAMAWRANLTKTTGLPLWR